MSTQSDLMIALAATSLVVAANAGISVGATIKNGGFEAVQIATQSANPADTPGWIRTGTPSEGPLWRSYDGTDGFLDCCGVAHAAEGRQFVTLGTGYRRAPASSTWTTTITDLNIGNQYRLEFLRAHEAGFSGPQTITVSIDGGPGINFTSLSADTTPYWNTWENKSLFFTATGTTASLSFSATTSFDIGLDNVRISAPVL